MKALVLAAGYATRLRPLTDETAKPLLELAGRPIIDYICDRIDRAGDIEELHVLSNDLFLADFERWGAAREGRLRPHVHSDGTNSNAERLGAIAGIRLVVEQAGLDGEDLLVVAGDNVFEFSLGAEIDFWRSREEESGGGAVSCVAVQRCPDSRLASLYGVVELDEKGRIFDFVEKPSNPPSDLIATATYIFAAEHVALIADYLAAGNSPDQPGNFLAWLHVRKPVFGFVFDDLWLDIGDSDQLREADRIMRSRGAR